MQGSLYSTVLFYPSLIMTVNILFGETSKTLCLWTTYKYCRIMQLGSYLICLTLTAASKALHQLSWENALPSAKTLSLHCSFSMFEWSDLLYDFNIIKNSNMLNSKTCGRDKLFLPSARTYYSKQRFVCSAFKDWNPLDPGQC